MGAIKKHVLVGISAGILLLAVYVVVITLVQDWQHTLQQTAKLWYWLVLLAAGLGVQAGLYSFIRDALKARKATATASVAASGSVSAGSMIACCAHHLGDVLPFVGLAGAAAFFAEYQVFFIVLGVVSNFIGITIMLETVQRHNLCPWVSGWRWNMKKVKKAAMFSAPAVLALVALLTGN